MSEHSIKMPQAIPLEEATLGAIMLDSSAMGLIVDTLSPESFYKKEHQSIYQAALNLWKSGKSIDLLTITEELTVMGELAGIGGPYQLVELTNRVASSANIEYHARIVEQKHIRRKLILGSHQTVQDAANESKDVFDVLGNSYKMLESIEGALPTSSKTISSIVSDCIGDLERISNGEASPMGVTTGFDIIDEATLGWQKGEFIIIAARPSMGKTALVLQNALAVAKERKGEVVIASYEMSAKGLVNRLLCIESGINKDDLRRAKLTDKDWQKLHEAVDLISSLPISIIDETMPNIQQLRGKCLQIKNKQGLALVVIDYLQLIPSSDSRKSGTREQEVGAISRGCKLMAKSLDVPVVALSQLSRAVETRGGARRPIKSDLRESGSLEQDADWIFFLYRPEYYEIYEDEEGNSLRRLCEVICAKAREGALETYKLDFDGALGRYTQQDDGFECPEHDEDTTNTFKARMQAAQGDLTTDLPF